MDRENVKTENVRANCMSSTTTDQDFLETLQVKNRKLRKENKKLKQQLKSKEKAEDKRMKLETRLHPPFPNVIWSTPSPRLMGEIYAKKISKLRIQALEAQVRERDITIEMLTMQLDMVNYQIKQNEDDEGEINAEEREDADDTMKVGENGDMERKIKNPSLWRWRDEACLKSCTDVEENSEEIDSEEEDENDSGTLAEETDNEEKDENDSGKAADETNNGEGVEGSTDEEIYDKEMSMAEGNSIPALSQQSPLLPNQSPTVLNLNEHTPTLVMPPSRYSTRSVIRMSSLSTPDSSINSNSISTPESSPRDVYIPRYGKRKPVKKHGVNQAKLANGLFDCLCRVSFKNQGRLTEHIRYYTGDPKFQCQECPLQFMQLSYLKGHMKSCHKKQLPGGTIGCGDCGAIFTDREAHKSHRLELHLRQSNVEKYRQEHGVEEQFAALGMFRCKCGRNFTRMANLKSHVLNYTNTHEFQCELCHRSFKMLGRLHGHCRKVHKQKLIKGNMGCRLCGEIFSIRKALQQHIRTAHNILAVNQREEDLSTRRLEHGYHPASPASKLQGPGRFLYRCLCGSAFKSRRLLQCHLSYKQSSGAKFTCLHCPGEFRTHARLAKHIREGHKIKDYVGFGCTACCTVWPSSLALRQHQSAKHVRKSYKIRRR